MEQKEVAFNWKNEDTDSLYSCIFYTILFIGGVFSIWDMHVEKCERTAE
jgi:hypothetical protein